MTSPNLDEMSREELEELSKDELIDGLKASNKDQVVFFEPQREIILTNPTEETLNEFSNIAHMETSSEDHYKFQVQEMDIWNTNISLEELKEKYTRLVGSYPHFLEWLERT
jgi:thioredoxin-related protein